MFEDEHPNVICIPVLHITSSVTATYILFIVINISLEGILLRKGKILGFLEPIDINSNDLTTETVSEAVFQDRDLN